MKTSLLTLVSLICAITAQAHVSGVPHTHGEHSSIGWTTVLTLLAAIVVSIFAIRNLRNIKNR